MKRIIYISAWLFSFIFIIGFLFKILRLPGAFILLYTGGTVAGLICYPLLFFYKWREYKLTKNRLLFQWIFGQSAVVLFVISTWLRFSNMLLADVSFGISFAILSFAFLPLLFFNMYKESIKQI